MGEYVKWMITTNARDNILAECGSDNVVAIEPQLVITDLAKLYPGYLHYRCPAFIDALKNTYVVKAPFDFSIKIDPKERSIQADKDINFLQKYIHNRINDSIPTENMVVSFNFFMLFITDDDIELEQLPCLYHTSEWIENTQSITGKFNIKKWIRPIECAAIIKNSKPKDNVTIINIKRDDPLFYFRLHSKNDNKVILEQETNLNKIVEYTELIRVTSLVKATNPYLKLPILYKLFDRFRPKKFFSKCPFSFRR